MLEEMMRTGKGRFLLRHLFHCDECYAEWKKVKFNIPNGRHVAKIEEIIDTNHPNQQV